MEPAEIERRKPVWLALADFYLDTELQPTDFAHIRGVFAHSGYSTYEIKQINYDEVAPLLINNLFNIAGIWEGFDDQWLVKTISARLEQQATRHRPTTLFRWLWHRCVDSYTKECFEQVFNSEGGRNFMN